jgi:tetratricopeptide (TPR) repeat protein
LKLLTGGARDLPVRQQTIRSTIDWSYDLLDRTEQTLFAGLGVFVGGFTLEAAEAVCNADGDLPIDLVDGIAALVDKSLVRQIEGPDGEPRFAMLETIREYASERLAVSGEAEAVRRRHAEYHLALAEMAEPELYRAEQLAWLRQLEQEHDNMRAALAWSQTSADGVETGLRIAGALGFLWGMHGHRNEGRRWLLALLAHPAAALTAARANALIWAADFTENPSEAYALLEESLALGRALGHKTSVAEALLGLAHAIMPSAPERARALLEESLALYQELRDSWHSGLSIFGLGVLADRQGDFGQAIARYEESMALFRQHGDRYSIAIVSLHLLERRKSAQSYTDLVLGLEENLAVWRQIGDKLMCAVLLNRLGEHARWQEDYGRAATYYAESLALFQEQDSRAGIALVRTNQGYLAHNRGDEVQAAALLVEALLLARELADQDTIAYCLAGPGLGGDGAGAAGAGSAAARRVQGAVRRHRAFRGSRRPGRV